MNELIKAAQLVVEAHDKVLPVMSAYMNTLGTRQEWEETCKASDDLRAALSRQSVAPADDTTAGDAGAVAWRWKWKESVTSIDIKHPMHGWQYSDGIEKPRIHTANTVHIDVEPLYTRPAPAAQAANVLFNGFDINKLPEILISCVAKLWPGGGGMFWETALENMPRRIEELMTKAAQPGHAAVRESFKHVCNLWVDPQTHSYVVDHCDHPKSETVAAYIVQSTPATPPDSGTVPEPSDEVPDSVHLANAKHASGFWIRQQPLGRLLSAVEAFAAGAEWQRKRK